jgi:Zn-dependent peptidase ImmA (M78 family)/transcriptional regulator with XRE-family HTH domain
MAQRVEALARPELLLWARKAAGVDLEVAAKKASVPPERLESWEEGSARPTINQLRKLANAYKRPIAAFFLPKAPRIPDPPKDFRRPAGHEPTSESPLLRLEIRKAALRRKAALELLALEDKDPPQVRLQLTKGVEPETAGQQVRELLGVSLEEQFDWKGPYDAFNGWREAIESSGILVTQMEEIPSGEASGLSLAEQPLPVIVANIKDTPRRRVFTLLHEVCHVLMKEDGLCDLDDFSAGSRTRLETERFCNAVAAAALVPKEALLAQRRVKDHPKGDPQWSPEDIHSLAARFCVSQEAILGRLLTLGRTDWSYYRAAAERLEDDFDDFQRSKKKRTGPPSRALIAVATSGPTLAHLVLEGYARGRITATDASDYLNVQIKHFPKIQERVSER